MNPITYIEATCEACSDEIYNGMSDVDFAVLKNGKLLCKTCGEQKPDQVFKWFSVAKQPEPEDEDPTPPAESLEEIEDIEEPEEEPEG